MTSSSESRSPLNPRPPLAWSPHMRLPRIVLVAFVGLCLLGVAGCKAPCRQLAEALCQCAGSTLARESCLQDVSRRDAFADPTDEDQDRCEALLDRCDCNNLDTPEGKQACGLARE
jgi:hypothetical protein